MKPSININIFNYLVHSFYFFGAVGYFLGLFAGVGLAYYTNLIIWPVLLCGLTGAGVLVGLTYLYKWITGKEDLVYYQHEIAILICCTIVLLLFDKPVLQYLDITLMGIGIFLVFGRIGCFSVGCCHGKPNKKYGVLYSQKHVEEGFPEYYMGIPLFPIQLMESISVAIITIIGVSTILLGSEPGTAILIYSIIYGFIRFVLEFFRGDPERPYWLNFSEAQWTTLGIFMISALFSWYGLLPLYNWHLWAVAGLIVFMLITFIIRKQQALPLYKILQPKHVSEIATGIAALENQKPNQEDIVIAYTSLGLNISMGRLKEEEEEIIFYTLSAEQPKNKKSSRNFFLNYETAKVIGNLLQTLKHEEEPFEIIEEQSGVSHIVFGNYQKVKESPTFTDQSIALGIRRNLRYRYN